MPFQFVVILQLSISTATARWLQANLFLYEKRVWKTHLGISKETKKDYKGAFCSRL
jgi:hypothetical protein